MRDRSWDHLSTSTLRLYASSDVIGAELGGALKNVIAIACGATIGAGYQNSARRINDAWICGNMPDRKCAWRWGGTLSGLSGLEI